MQENIVNFGFSFNTLGMLLALVALEAILGADNAIALASLVEPIKDQKHQRLALDWGLLGAFLLRIVLILTATWIINFWQFELAGSLYLLWLSSKYFWEHFFIKSSEKPDDNEDSNNQNSLWQIIILIAITDFAFSLDSVTAGVALSNQAWLIVTGGIIGIISLRFLACLFIIWLTEFTYLQHAAYLTILAVGIRLFFKALLPDYIPPEWSVIALITLLFIWGFSKRVLPETEDFNISKA